MLILDFGHLLFTALSSGSRQAALISWRLGPGGGRVEDPAGKEFVMTAQLFRHAPLDVDAGETDGARVIIAPRRDGWDQLAMGEWELRTGGFGDCHPHDEVNYVLVGRLEVDCGGERLVAGPGDVVRVPANEPAYYYASEYARMLYIYGPNPTGEPAWTFTDRARVSPPEAG
jgi:quercetin dioxygenase-like cupin family protein